MVNSKDAEQAVFNYTNALETFMGKREVLARVLQKFMAKVDTQLELMRDTLSLAGDPAVLKNEAHAIKGGALSLDASSLARKALALEQAVNGENPDLAQLVDELAGEFQFFKEYVISKGYHN